ncbi:uncharacterized protein LOC143888878 [Tasmannia lanceolata]|uniref:uncharacterized protein LOC143888878 n=1 Tax=Tasmannia lanceolata TaxID=3420 RepID=UPI004064C573
MSLHFLRTRLFGISFTQHSTTTYVFFLQNPYLKSISTLSNPNDQPSFTVSYLVHSCGLSEAAALLAAKKVRIETAKKPDSVLSSLQSYDFDKTHITKLITKCPSLLLVKPDKTLKPKFGFFRDLGLSGPDLAKILCSDPYILKRSLEKEIMPSIDFLRSHISTNENIVFALRRSSRLLQLSFQKRMVSNVSTLETHGVPKSGILKLIMNQSRALMVNPDRFSENIMTIKEMGFDPLTSTFIRAVFVMSLISKLTWEAKLEVYRSEGWSENEVVYAFKSQPMCMAISEKKIRKASDYFVNKMGWKPSFISRNPILLNLSLEKRVHPRCSVMQILMSEGLIDKDLNLAWVLKLTEIDFMEKFVIKNQEKIPKIRRLYENMIGAKLIGSKLTTRRLESTTFLPMAASFNFKISSICSFEFCQNPYLKSISTLSNPNGQSSFTVSYVVNSCGLSEAAALLAAKKVSIETAEKPDSVLCLLQNYDFDKTQISKLITKFPSLLLANPDKTLKPKFEFFCDLGLSGPHLAKILCSSPYILGRSLKKHIIPSIDFLRSHLRTNENIVFALRRSSGLLHLGFQERMVSNVSTLQKLGVPEPGISKLLLTQPTALMVNPDRFSENIMAIKELAFNPLKSIFIQAVCIMSGISKSNWEAKLEVYRSEGWSENEILNAFKRQPRCMAISEKKIRKMSGHFVNKMGWKPSVISRNPTILSLSFEKRIQPRCSVMQILMSEGLMDKDLNLAWVLLMTEKDFKEKFVIENQQKVPKIQREYKNMIGAVGLDNSSKELGAIQMLRCFHNKTIEIYVFFCMVLAIQ